jgi:hypothetical protein
MHAITGRNQLAELDFRTLSRYAMPMLRGFATAVALCALLSSCGATETNVAPAPCTVDADCGPDRRCAPLEEVDATGRDAGLVPTFCRPR